jgi:hypothetical protein
MTKSILKVALWIIFAMWGCSNQMKTAADGNQFDGIWAEDEISNALFKIKGDTIENVEHGNKMYFNVMHDTMTIDYIDSKMKYFIVKFSEDSLVLQNPDRSITRLCKRRR